MKIENYAIKNSGTRVGVKPKSPDCCWSVALPTELSEPHENLIANSNILHLIVWPKLYNDVTTLRQKQGFLVNNLYKSVMLNQ